MRDDGDAGKNHRRLEAKAILVSERLEAGDELHAALLTVLGDCPPRLMPDKPAAALDRDFLIQAAICGHAEVKYSELAETRAGSGP